MVTLLALLSTEAQAQQGRDEFGVTLSAAGGWYFTDELENLEQTWAMNARLGYSLTQRVIVEGQTGYHQGVTRQFGHRYDSFSPRLDLLIVLTPDYRVQPFIAVGGGAFYTRVNRDPNSWSTEPIGDTDIGNYKNPDSDALVNGGPGLMIKLAGAMSLRFDARWMTTIGTEPHSTADSDVFNNVELTGGFIFRAADRGKDTDEDGIMDKIDACPEDPEDWDGFEDPDGCPEWDNDQDGVLDEDDDCPLVKEDMDDWDDEDGCPEDDNDSDGLVDWEDECPNEREDQDGYRDGDGCPEFDNDRDGISDLNDRCPNHPEDVDGFEDEDGCEEPDNDGDGIADVVDACEMDPELYNGFEDADGCPDELPPEVVKFTGVIRGINFEVDSDKITVDSYFILNEAAAVLVQYDGLRIEVQGHTDSDGSDDYNFDLSDRRAESVVRYMTNQGVEAGRLTWMGYGESRPLVPNENEETKAVNRRVEFHIVEAEPLPARQ
ncbi:MAG: OmpA family protein [Proteobacteria bacterium]|nr:OmpA family protein [Pseudomonadota bacterium]MCP4922018.1 OmpA family protein [Pseudomonadota bacterium]